MELPAKCRSATPPRATKRCASVVLLWLIPTGCHLFVGTNDALDPSSVSTSSDAPAADSQSAGASRTEGPALDEATSGSVRSVLNGDGWVLRIAGDTEVGKPSRWRHAGLDDLLSRPPDRLPAFTEWLDDPSAVVAANAAIALARLQRKAGMQRLTATVRSPQLSLAHRSAAAEALGWLDDSQASAAIRSLLRQYGAGGESDEIPELHAELIRAYSQRPDKDLEAILQRALKSHSPNVRQAALEVWPRQPPGPLPESVYDLANASDARLRGAAIRLIVARDQERAKPVALRGLADHDLQVRLVSIRAMGTLHDDATGRQLRQLLDDHAEKIRAAAVDALARRTQFHDVYAVAADKSWRVRQHVADALRHDHSAAAAAVAEQLAADASGRVARSALESVAAWPLELAGPALLAAVESPLYRIRKVAAEHLGRRWPAAADFPWEGSVSQRTSAMEQLRARWAEQFGASLQEATSRFATSHGLSRDNDDLALRRAMQCLSDQATDPETRRQVIDRLSAMGPDLVTAMDAYVAESHPEMPDVVYGKVLPEVAPIFADLARMHDGGQNDRRRAARRLAARGRGKDMPLTALTHLAEMVTVDPDADVWRTVLTELADDSRTPAIRLHLAGMSHPDAGVRCLACRYLARHGGAEQVDWLLAALDDADRSVVRAAVEGLASAERLSDPLPLIRLLADRDTVLTVRVAYTLARHGHTSGEAALQRLAKCDDSDVRREAAQAMGRLGNSVFAATLVEMLDDRLEIRRAAASGLDEMLGPTVSGADQGPNVPLADRIGRLKRWFAANGNQLIRPRPEERRSRRMPNTDPDEP